MNIRPYLPTDRPACLAVFDSNTPPFFHPSERRDFAKFLNHPDCAYFVMENGAEIVGCGGYHLEPDESLASLVWGMVRQDCHHIGLGRLLLMFRLREIGKAGDIEAVRIDTSQLTAPFFEFHGFRVLSVESDAYGPGLNRLEMRKKLKVCP